MADATADRDTVKAASAVQLPQSQFPALASTTYYRGCMYEVDTDGRAKTPTTTTNFVMGVCKEKVDNSAGAADAKTVVLEHGCFKFAVSATNPPDATNVGDLMYAEDNQTISDTGTDGPIVGTMERMDADGDVWVNIGPEFHK